MRRQKLGGSKESWLSKRYRVENKEVNRQKEEWEENGEEPKFRE